MFSMLVHAKQEIANEFVCFVREISRWRLIRRSMDNGILSTIWSPIHCMVSYMIHYSISISMTVEVYGIPVKHLHIHMTSRMRSRMTSQGMVGIYFTHKHMQLVVVMKSIDSNLMMFIEQQK